MKKISIGVVSIMLFVGLAGTASAHGNGYDDDHNHPQKDCSDLKFIKNLKDNPNVVAYYLDGPHGIPGESELHTGIDIVIRKGTNGTFHQWFCGTSASEGVHGEFTIWKVKQGSVCKPGWILMPHANPDWGDYLTPGVDYCTLTRDFKIGKDSKIQKTWKHDDQKGDYKQKDGKNQDCNDEDDGYAND